MNSTRITFNDRYITVCSFKDGDREFSMSVKHLKIPHPGVISNHSPELKSCMALGRVLFKLLRY